MWFEILPSFGIITVALSLPSLGVYALHKYVLGNPYGRDLNERFQRVLYSRDIRLTGDPYKWNGLDAIPPIEKEPVCPAPSASQ